MRKIEIALGSDGVLGDLMSGILRVVHEVTGRRFELMAVTERDFTRALGLSPLEAREVKRVLSARRGFVTALSPYPAARQGVRRLRELGDVFCVTCPRFFNPWWCEERASWLALHFGIDRVHHAIDKTAYGADVFVDDEASHVREWLGAWPDRTAVFWRTPHNTGEAVPWGAHSVSSWDALYQIARGAAEVSPAASMTGAP